MSFEFGKGRAGGSIEFIAPKAGSNLGRCNRLRFEIQFAEITAGYILDKVKKRTLANQRWASAMCPTETLVALKREAIFGRDVQSEGIKNPAQLRGLESSSD